MGSDRSEADSPIEVALDGGAAEPEKGKSRRRLLAMLGAGGAALVAGPFSRDEALAGHDNTNVLHLGEVNFDPDTGKGTQLQADANEFALWVENNNGGPGAGGILASAGGTASAFEAFADSGIGVLGSSRSGAAVEGRSDTHIGGLFSTNSGTGVRSDSQTGHGVDGRSHNDAGIGVRGEVDGNGEGVQGSSSLNGDFGRGPGTGVSGITGTGIGVRGVSDSGTGVKAEAASPAGVALEVLGRVVFSTAGSAIIPAAQDSVFVSNPAVTDESHITVTFTGSPGIPLAGFPILVLWVERQPGTGFVIHLTRKTGQATPFTYLIVEPG